MFDRYTIDSICITRFTYSKIWVIRPQLSCYNNVHLYHSFFLIQNVLRLIYLLTYKLDSLKHACLSFFSTSYHNIVTFRPRLLLSGYTGQGQSMHIGPAILHQMEKYPVHVLDLPSLFGVTAKSPEESCAQVRHW